MNMGGLHGWDPAEEFEPKNPVGDSMSDVAIHIIHFRCHDFGREDPKAYTAYSPDVEKKHDAASSSA